MIIGVFQVNTWVALLAASGMVLGAAYMLYLYRRVIFGALTLDDLKGMLDLNWRERVVFAPLVAIVFWMGIYPSSFIDVMAASVENVIVDYEESLAAAGVGPTDTILGDTLLAGILGTDAGRGR